MSTGPRAKSSGSTTSGSLILLAAGRGSRFGRDKRQQPMPSGTHLLGTTLNLYQAYYSQIVVVLRPGDEALGAELLLNQQTQLVYAADAAQGMGHSLACGARALLACIDQDYFTVALADMPYIEAATLHKLQHLCVNTPPPFILQPTYAGKPGNPVCFSSSHLEGLLTLKGDEGARALVQANQDQLHRIPVADPGVLHDIDRPEDILG